MIDLFQRASSDKSYEYLGQIFGAMNGLFPDQGDTGVLGVMFRTFNSTILAVAALMLVYMTIVGVIATAHEGEFMGKKWNNIWIPIRSVLGIALLVPTSSGFCGIQIIMMWVIIQGIGAADVLWTTALTYVNSAGSVYAKTDLPTVGANSTIQGLFQGLVCDASARLQRSDPTDVDKGGYYCNSNSDRSCSAPLTLNAATGSLTLGPNGSCGTLTFCNLATSCAAGAGTASGSMSCSACQAQIASLQSIIGTLSPIAMQFVMADYAYRNFIANSGSTGQNASTFAWLQPYCRDKGLTNAQCCVNTSANASCAGAGAFADPNRNGSATSAGSDAVALYWKYWPMLGPNLGMDTNFINTSASFYSNSLQTTYDNYVASQANSTSDTSNLTDKLADAQADGWIFAGGFYYNIASYNGSTMKSSLPESSFTSGDMSSVMKDYRNNVDAAKCLLNTINGSSCSAGDVDAFSGPVTEAQTSTSGLFESTVSGEDGSNPLAQIALAGSVMMLIVEIVFYVMILLIVVLGIAGFLNIYVLGTGLDNPIGPTAQFIMIFILPAIYALFGYMITLGGLLAIYIPLMPYIIFTFGAIGWLISVIEAMVAGPLVALGIISPSGQHELMGKAEPAIMLLFGIFLRPSLMIFGLVSAMLLSSVVVTMINALFWTTVFQGMSETAPMGLFAIIMMLGAYVSLLVAALSKCFGIINALPASVMRWISGHGEGEQAPLDQIKGGIEGAGGGVSSGVSGARSSIAAADKAQGASKKELAGGDAKTSAGTPPSSSHTGPNAKPLPPTPKKKGT